MPTEFKVDNYIVLKLEKKETVIYIDGKKFRQCKHLFLVNPYSFAYENYNSIDEVAKALENKLEGNNIAPRDLGITPEEIFLGHCSNLQVWVENDYDSRILHSTLAFPLLKALTILGCIKAENELQKQILERLKGGKLDNIKYLIKENLLGFLSKEAFFSLAEEIDFRKLIKEEKLFSNLMKIMLEKCESEEILYELRNKILERLKFLCTQEYERFLKKIYFQSKNIAEWIKKKTEIENFPRSI